MDSTICVIALAALGGALAWLAWRQSVVLGRSNRVLTRALVELSVRKPYDLLATPTPNAAVPFVVHSTPAAMPPGESLPDLEDDDNPANKPEVIGTREP